MIVKGNKVFTTGGAYLSPGYVVVEGTTIKSVSAELSDDALSKCNMDGEYYEADIVCAGFVDIHNHGIGGSEELLEYWLHDYTFKKLPGYATTSVLASLTYPLDYTVTKQVINTLKQRYNRIIEGEAVLAGIHSEGPIVSDCGGLPHSHADTMALPEFVDILDCMGESLKIMTISPTAEAKCNYERLRVLLDRGVTPALGHDKNASEEDILGALRVCATKTTATTPVRPHITHIFNVSSFHHRLPSLVNFGMVERFPNEEKYLGLPVPTVELVADMVHVSPLAFGAVLASRKPQHVACITDAVMDVSGHDMLYSGCKMALKEIAPGRKAVVLHGTNTIAGSCTNLLQVFQTLINIMEVPIESAVQMLSETPSKIVKIDQTVGSIVPGKRADIVMFDNSYQLTKTIIAGKVVFSA